MITPRINQNGEYLKSIITNVFVSTYMLLGD